jgi:hypothetical protein
VLQGAWSGSHKHVVNFWLITQAFYYQHKKYKITQATQQYENINAHNPYIDTSCLSLLPNAETKQKIKFSVLVQATC